MSYTTISFDVSDRSNILNFIQVAWEFYKNDSAWVPPLLKERLDLLSPSHPYFEHAQANFWIAYQNDKPVGRISAQIDQLKSSSDIHLVGYFGLFECIDDDALANELLKKAEQWLVSKNCKIIRGPYNLSINQESGLLIDGFSTPPFIMMGHARPYYAKLLLSNGYEKAKDMYAWINHSEFLNPPAMERLIERYSNRIILRNVEKKYVKRDIKYMFEIFNDAWEKNWGFIPFTENEFFHLGKEMMLLVDPEYFIIAELDGEPVGMIAALPNFNETIKDLNGRLFPTGWIKFLWRLKFSPPVSARVPLLGIKQQYQNTLIGSALAYMLIGKIKGVGIDRGITSHELSWVLEDNDRLNKILESLGSTRYKTYRIFEKNLSQSV